MRPLPDSSTRFTDGQGQPTRDFYNWLREIERSVNEVTTGLSDLSTVVDGILADDGLVDVDTGAIGYKTGAGGAVTQGSGSGKATAVTLDKPSGQITMNNAALAGGATVSFVFNNSKIVNGDVLCLNTASSSAAAYRIDVTRTTTGSAVIAVTNITGGSLSEAVILSFVLIKGAFS